MITADTAWPRMSVAQAHAYLTGPGMPFEMEEVVVRGAPMRVWKNALPTLREVFLRGQAFGERDFIVFEDDRATYAAFGKATLALAAALQDAGVAKGDRVAIVMANRPEWLVAFFAAALTGAVVAPLNVTWAPAELSFGVNHSGAKVVILGAEAFDRLSGRLDDWPGVETVWVSRGQPSFAHAKVRDLGEVIGPVAAWAALPERAPPDVVLHPDDPATIFYTSGTTGRPKGAVNTHRNLTSNVHTAQIAYARAAVLSGIPYPGPPQPDPPQLSTLVVVPFFHVTGVSATACPGYLAGQKLVLMRWWVPQRAMQLIERERINGLSGVPIIAAQLAEHPARQQYDLSSLIRIGYGGAPSGADLPSKLSAGGHSPSNGWGMTETTATFTMHVGQEYLHHPESCGPPPPVGEMRIVADDGREAEPGEVGELWVKGPQVAAGYWNDPEETANTFVDGWLRTGDLGRLDAEGYCYIVDRSKDMLIRAGENIYCIEVENALCQHEAVAEAALVGVAHKLTGEEPVAMVVLRDGASASEAQLRAFVADRLAAYKVPVRVLFSPEPLPRTVNGKILKTQLRERLEAPDAIFAPA